jgi:hypothetical protein
MRFSDNAGTNELMVGLTRGFAPKLRGGINNHGAAKAKWSVTIGTGTNAATYTFLIGNKSFSYVAASTNTTVIATAILAALRADTRFMGLYSFSSSAAIVYIEANDWGSAYDFTCSDSDAKLTTARVTTGADAAIMPFASCACHIGRNGYGSVKLCNPSDATFESQEITITYVNVNNDVKAITVTGPTGVVEVFAIPMSASSGDTQDDFVSGLAAGNIGTYFDITEGSTDLKVVLTAKTPGNVCKVEMPGATITEASYTLDTDFNKKFYGVTVRDNTRVGGYQPNQEVQCIFEDPISVRLVSGVTVAHGDPVFYVVADHTFTNTYADGAVFVKGATFIDVVDEQNVYNGPAALIQLSI